MPDPMTAEALSNLVSQWPMEARPEGLDFVERDYAKGYRPHWTIDQGTCDFCAVQHAIALHEASGLRWLLHEWCCSVRICPPELGDGTAYVIVIGGNMQGNAHSAPTIIEALHHAVMATAKEKA